LVVVANAIQPPDSSGGFLFNESPLKRRLDRRRKESSATRKMKPQTRRQSKQTKPDKRTGTKDAITASETTIRTTTN
jgi:hypothetical protein